MLWSGVTGPFAPIPPGAGGPGRRSLSEGLSLTAQDCAASRIGGIWHIAKQRH
jgi:hypothetical protein